MPENRDPKAGSGEKERKVEVQTWRAVMAVHGSVFSRLSRAMVKDFGITLAKFDVLAQLDRAPDGLTQGALSRQLKVTGGNVTGLTSRLAADGLITREMSANDRRTFVVRLTARGAELYRAARLGHDALLADLLSAIDVADLSQALHLLRIIERGIEGTRESEQK